MGPLHVLPTLPWNLSLLVRLEVQTWPGSLSRNSSVAQDCESLHTHVRQLLGGGLVSSPPDHLQFFESIQDHFTSVILVEILISRKPTSSHPQFPELSSLCLWPPAPASPAQDCLVEASFHHTEEQGALLAVTRCPGPTLLFWERE